MGVIVLGYIGIALIFASFVGMAILCWRAPVRENFARVDRELKRRGL